MKRSTTGILTTHCGSLPRPRELLAPLHAKDGGDAYDADDLARRVRSSVIEVVRKQADLGIDVVDLISFGQIDDVLDQAARFIDEVAPQFA